MDLLTQSREEFLSIPGRPVRSHGDHRHILAAVEARDSRRAEQAMLSHIVGVERLVMGRAERSPGRDLRPSPPAEPRARRRSPRPFRFDPIMV